MKFDDVKRENELIDEYSRLQDLLESFYDYDYFFMRKKKSGFGFDQLEVKGVMVQDTIRAMYVLELQSVKEALIDLGVEFDVKNVSSSANVSGEKSGLTNLGTNPERKQI